MKLYHLAPIDPMTGPWNPWYDKAFGFVVRASNENEARELAADNSGDEGEAAWKDVNLSICVELTTEGRVGMIERNFASA